MPWGCNQFSIIAKLLACQAGADVVCAAGTYTTAMSINGANQTAQVQSNDSWFPVLTPWIVISLGATPPTALIIGYAIVSGTEIDSIAVPTQLLVANAQLMFSVPLIGPSSKLTWLAGAAPLIEVNPTAQPVTVRAQGGAGSRALFQLFLGAA